MVSLFRAIGGFGNKLGSFGIYRGVPFTNSSNRQNLFPELESSFDNKRQPVVPLPLFVDSLNIFYILESFYVIRFPYNASHVPYFSCLTQQSLPIPLLSPFFISFKHSSFSIHPSTYSLFLLLSVYSLTLHFCDSVYCSLIGGLTANIHI